MMAKAERQYINKVNSLGDSEIPKVSVGILITNNGDAKTITSYIQGTWYYVLNDQNRSGLLK
jgi:hypothetical protein